MLLHQTYNSSNSLFKGIQATNNPRQAVQEVLIIEHQMAGTKIHRFPPQPRNGSKNTPNNGKPGVFAHIKHTTHKALPMHERQNSKTLKTSLDNELLGRIKVKQHNSTKYSRFRKLMLDSKHVDTLGKSNTKEDRDKVSSKKLQMKNTKLSKHSQRPAETHDDEKQKGILKNNGAKFIPAKTLSPKPFHVKNKESKPKKEKPKEQNVKVKSNKKKSKKKLPGKLKPPREPVIPTQTSFIKFPKNTKKPNKGPMQKKINQPTTKMTHRGRVGVPIGGGCTTSVPKNTEKNAFPNHSKCPTETNNIKDLEKKKDKSRMKTKNEIVSRNFRNRNDDLLTG